jgi:hypothetical protein
MCGTACSEAASTAAPKRNIQVSLVDAAAITSPLAILNSNLLMDVQPEEELAPNVCILSERSGVNPALSLDSLQQSLRLPKVHLKTQSLSPKMISFWNNLI